MKILIAEDEAMMLAALEKNLTDEGYEVIAVQDGSEALKVLETVTPDLILTDIMMPYTSGMELIGVVKSNSDKAIPIIVLSAMGQESVVMDAFQLGADDFITKPFNPTELSVRVKRLLMKKK
jgi:DNA-binding response OmpR family regulator